MKRLIPILLLLFVTGCVGNIVPETPRERLVVAEASYAAAVKTAGDLALRGLVKADQADEVIAAMDAARAALDIWHLTPDSQDQMTLALASLQALQALLDQLAKGMQETAYIPIVLNQGAFA